ncbi:MAG: hypothetical protein EBQ73_02910, partial [Gammaproteobacteria bacterium]|nr:hypothetical protein [Gammaproteobacteria bacterium]
MHSSTPPPQNDLSSGAIDALLKGLSAADAAAAQAEIDRLIQSAVSDAEVRHEREALAIKEVHQREALALQEAFQSEALAAQEAYQREILAKQEAHQLEALAAEAAHQKEMREAHAAYQEHIQSIYEQIRLSRQRLFGRSSEAHPGQLSLQFDEVEQTAEGSTDEHDQALMSAVDAQAPEGTQKAGRSAPRARGKRSPIPPHITRVEIVIDVPESQRVCPCCGKMMVAIGEDISEQLTIIPMKIQALQYHRKRYGCPTREHAPVIADRPPQVLPKTNASNDLLAMLITAKYVDG